MSEPGSSEIEEVVNILLSVERQLDDIKANIEQEKIKLRELGRNEILEEIEDEYFGYFDEIKEVFSREGFNSKGEQLTDSVWIICASL